MSGAWPWAAVALLGAYHGIDPSMGWLFAVALGLQERRRAKVLAALVPIAIGHLASVGAVVALVVWAAFLVASRILRPTGAAILVCYGLFRLLRPQAHPRWVAMRVSAAELALWSFLMASAHGAGLMLFPIVMGMRPGSGAAMMGHRMPAALASGPISVGEGAAIVVLHTSVMLVAMGAVALVVYDFVGLKILRSAWINLDLIWAGALIGAGLLTLLV